MAYSIVKTSDETEKMTAEEFQEGLSLLRQSRANRELDAPNGANQPENHTDRHENPYKETTIPISDRKPLKFRPRKMAGHIQLSFLYPSIFCNWIYILYIAIIILLVIHSSYCLLMHHNKTFNIQYHDNNNTCAFFYPYKQGYRINNYLYYNNMNWSLHGWWPSKRKDSIKLCLSYENFTELFVDSFLSKFLIDGNMHTYKCCHFQYHEYWKHGCMMGYSYDDWYHGSASCLLLSKDDRRKHVTHWHFCEEYNCNIVLQTTNNSITNYDDLNYCYNVTSC